MIMSKDTNLSTNIVPAVYKEQKIDEYKNNPLIECLPPISSKDEAITALENFPSYNSRERLLESQYRIHLVCRLFSVFQPFAIHLDLESRISRIIRQGYIARNPFNPSFISRFQDGYNEIHGIKSYNRPAIGSTASGFYIVGISGCGKSSAISSVMKLYDQVICHSYYKGMNYSQYQLVYLKLECPYDGSIRGLCLDFFYKVDSLLGTTYYKKYAIGRKSIDQLISIMGQIARSIQLGCIIIDELQHLNMAKSGGAEKVLNWMVTVINSINIPVIAIGTPRVLNILQSDFRQARRGSGITGDLFFDRLKQDATWDLLLKSIWTYQFTKNESPLTHELSNVIYQESQGITDIAVKLYAMSQVRAINTGKEVVNESVIKQVSKENLKLVRPMLDALKTGNIKAIAKYEDISTYDINFDDFCDHERESIDLGLRIKALDKAKKEKERQTNMTIKEEAIIKLLDLNIEPAKAKKAVEDVINENIEETDISEVVIKAIQQLSDSNGNSKVRKKFSKPSNGDDVRFIVSEGRKKNQTAYESLKAKGYIKNPEEDYFIMGVN